MKIYSCNILLIYMRMIVTFFFFFRCLGKKLIGSFHKLCRHFFKKIFSNCEYISSNLSRMKKKKKLTKKLNNSLYSIFIVENIYLFFQFVNSPFFLHSGLYVFITFFKFSFLFHGNQFNRSIYPFKNTNRFTIFVTNIYFHRISWMEGKGSHSIRFRLTLQKMLSTQEYWKFWQD